MRILAVASGTSENSVTVGVPEGLQWKSFKPLVIAPDGSQIETQTGPGGIVISALPQSGFYSVGADFLDESGARVGQTAPKTASTSVVLKLPEDMLSGPCSVQAYVILKGAMIGAGSAPFNCLSAPETFKGTLTDRITKKPIPKGTLSFHLGGVHFETSADDAGAFELQIPAGKFKLQAKADGYNELNGSALLSKESPRLSVELLPAGSGTGLGTLRGRVIDRVAGKALPHMELSLRGGSQTYSLRSDVAGGWSAALLPGNYEIHCLIDGSANDVSRFELRAVEGLELEQDLYPAVGKLRFKVFDGASGKEIKDARALIRTAEGWKRDVSPSLNSERVQLLQPGRGVIQLSAEGYETLETEFYAGERPSDFTAYLRPLVCGASFEILNWVAEKPVEGALVSLNTQGLFPQRTDARGVARFNGVAMGRREITLEASGYQKLTTERYFQASAAGPAQFRLYLKPDRTANPGTARFIVKDLVTCEPLGGVKISCENVSTATKADGTAEMALPDGRRTLTFTRNGFKPIETECIMNAVNAEAETYWLTPLNTSRTFILRNLVTGAPLKGVEVKLKSGGKEYAAKTDAKVFFAFKLPTGVFDLKLSLSDYHRLETSGYSGGGNRKDIVEDYVLSPSDALMPSGTGSILFDVNDAVTGTPVTLFQARIADTLQIHEKWAFEREAPSRNRSVSFTADGYESPGRYSTAFLPGQTVKCRVHLWPTQSEIEFQACDALTLKPLDAFAGKLPDSPDAVFTGGTAAGRSKCGNGQTYFMAWEYAETGSFYPAAFQRRTAERRIFLWPAAGEIRFTPRDEASRTASSCLLRRSHRAQRGQRRLPGRQKRTPGTGRRNSLSGRLSFQAPERRRQRSGISGQLHAGFSHGRTARSEGFHSHDARHAQRPVTAPHRDRQRTSPHSRRGRDAARWKDLDSGRDKRLRTGLL